MNDYVPYWKMNDYVLEYDGEVVALWKYKPSTIMVQDAQFRHQQGRQHAARIR